MWLCYFRTVPLVLLWTYIPLSTWLLLLSRFAAVTLLLCGLLINALHQWKRRWRSSLTVTEEKDLPIMKKKAIPPSNPESVVVILK
jgi:hypothetical protein